MDFVDTCRVIQDKYYIKVVNSAFVGLLFILRGYLFPKLLSWLCSPSNPLLNGYRELFPRG
jgi:hypothetical protein